MSDKWGRLNKISGSLDSLRGIYSCMEMASALDKVKVIDLTHLPPGDYCTWFLSDLGAEVIKILPPDSEGSLIASLSGIESERWSAFYPYNRNKQSMILNLKKEEGRQVLYELAKRADVIVEGFRPGVAKRLGIDYETISKVNPGIIYCSLSGYGQSGPYSLRPGHDINYISIGGALGILGKRNGAPVIPSNMLADWAGAGLHGVIGILVALLARDRIGTGQYVDMAYIDGVISLMGYHIAMYFCTGVVPSRGGTALTGDVPYYNVYETRDGKYIAIGCIEQHFWRKLCQELRCSDLIPYQYAAGSKKKEVFSRLRKTFLSKTRDEWCALLKDKDIPIAPIYTIDEVLSDPQVLHRQMIVEVPHPSWGKVRQIGIPIKLSKTPGEIRDPSPLRGEHTESILTRLGYSKGAINSLRRAGAIP